MRASLGIHVRGVCLPHPDCACPITLLDGELRRAATAVPIDEFGCRLPPGAVLPYTNFMSSIPGSITNKTNFYSSTLPDSRFTQYQLDQWPRILEMIDRQFYISDDFHKPATTSQDCIDVFRNLFLHTIHMVQEEFEMAPPDTDFGIEAWLEKTGYAEFEKERLRESYKEDSKLTSKEERCKCFCKAETYPEEKPARPIKSRTDRFKCEVGPAFQVINEYLFKHECFVKKIPLPDRPAYLRNLVDIPGATISCTDFSKFESHFTNIVMNIIEFTFYSYILFKTTKHDIFMKLVRRVLAGKQHFDFKFFTTSYTATRASGEMCTSSGNGFTNYCVYKFVCRMKGATYAKGGHEGDDGITATLPPTCAPTSSDYFYLGWFCKMENVKKFSEASFCGIVSDDEELINVCDIVKAVAEVGWTGEKYAFASTTTHKALIRAKGYSMVYQYYKCPILDSLGRYMLRITDGDIIEKKMLQMLQRGQIADLYKREILKQAISNGIPPKLECGPRTRELVDRLYKISHQVQLETELYLDSLNSVVQLELPLEFPDLWYKTYEKFTSIGFDSMFRTSGVVTQSEKHCDYLATIIGVKPFF